MVTIFANHLTSLTSKFEWKETIFLILEIRRLKHIHACHVRVDSLHDSLWITLKNHVLVSYYTPYEVHHHDDKDEEESEFSERK